MPKYRSELYSLVSEEVRKASKVGHKVRWYIEGADGNPVPARTSDVKVATDKSGVLWAVKCSCGALETQLGLHSLSEAAMHEHRGQVAAAYAATVVAGLPVIEEAPAEAVVDGPGAVTAGPVKSKK